MATSTGSSSLSSSNPFVVDAQMQQLRGPSISYGGVGDHPTSSNGGTSPASQGSVRDKAPLILEDHMDHLSMVTRPGGLSTISGVFAPVALSMFSILLFLRLGFVVGQLGFLMTFIQLIMAYSIILLTVLSLCAISSNGAIEGGDMISRSLGPEFGGSIGVLFFIANVFSCALYTAGFTEALVGNIGDGGTMIGPNSSGLPSSTGWKFVYSVIVSLLLMLVCLIGAALFAKTALATFVVISICYATFLLTVFIQGTTEIPVPKANALAYTVLNNDSDPHSGTHVDFNQTITANFTGFSFHTLGENLYEEYTIDYTTSKQTDFALLFAIIFSGVTGLMAGANMSGELARPGLSIPRGTVQAVLCTLSVYIFTAFLLACSCSRRLLHEDYTVMMGVNISPWFILVGICSTTLFSSMSNLIGASRVLNRVAQDKLFGFILRPASFEMGKRNPVASVIISWICVVGVLLIGALNKIAKITSIFFLLSYMAVNIACLALELTSAPNFRPGFKYFSWHTSALGVLATVIMMLVIDASMSAIAVVVLLFLLMVLHYQAPAGSWGSISQALIYHQVRKYLLLLDVRKEHVKYWRPQVLVLVSRPASCCPLMEFMNDLKKSGLYLIGHVQRGSMQTVRLDPLQQVYPYWLSLVDYLKLKAFVELTVSESIRHGIEQLVRLSGLGAMKPNIVVLGFHELSPSETTLQETRLLRDLRFSKIDRAEVVEYFTSADYMPRELNGNSERLNEMDYVNILRDVLQLHKNLCLARHFHRLESPPPQTLFRNWNSQKRFIDVWPVDLGCRTSESGLGWDNSSLFLLQLACILSMSSRWRSRTQLRVFICVNSLQDMHRRERQLKEMLGQLRISAKSLVMPWDHVVCHLGTSQNQNASRNRVENGELPLPYVTAMNEMIKKNSAETAVVFLNLPLPPVEDDASSSQRYLEMLRALSADLPPTLMVHGLASVISTAL